MSGSALWFSRFSCGGEGWLPLMAQANLGWALLALDPPAQGEDAAPPPQESGLAAPPPRGGPRGAQRAAAPRVVEA